MKPLILLLVLVSEVFTVAGQIFIKHAATRENATVAHYFRSFAPAIACLAAGFFTWTGAMQFMKLSELYPLEGLSRLMLVIGAVVFLKEKITPKLWIGVILICIGVVLVLAGESNVPLK